MKNICKKFQNEYEVLTPSGFKDFAGIKKIEKDFYYEIILENNLKLKCSDNHKIDTTNGYIYAKDLTLNTIIKIKGNISKIKEINIIKEKIELFDLIEVDDYRHRFYANNIVVSNCAFVPRNIWDEFYSSSYPTISSGKTTKVIFVSTPNGLNHFYKFWIDSEEGRNKFKQIRVDWWEVPGRDEKWKEETIANIGQIRFAQEFGNCINRNETIEIFDPLTKIKGKIPIGKFYELKDDNDVLLYLQTRNEI